jgi:hypothetical protein
MAELVLSIPNNAGGATAVQHLATRGEGDLGVSYRLSLGNRLAGLEGSSRLANLDHSFHLVEVPNGGEVGAINRIMRWHNGDGEPRSQHGRVDAAEPNLSFRPSATLGLPFKLGGSHQKYLQLMNVGDAHQAGIKGKDITVAVVDSGAEPGSVRLDDFYDVEGGNPIHPAFQIDNDGHGTAMATLVRNVAPEATIIGIRVFDQDTLNLWNVLAGTATAVFECHADIVSISLGYAQMPAQCLACGASAQSRSLAFQYLLDGVTRSPGKRGTPPIYVAATGNDYSSAGFNYPAAYDSAVAIGAVTSALVRSAFSNYGKSAPKYFFMAPGGEENPLGTVTEDVGSGGTAPCRGTSVATAYAAGMLAVLWSDARYRGQAPDVFLANVMQYDRLPLPQGSPDPHQYGSGLIQYPPAPEAAVFETQEDIKLLKAIKLLKRKEPHQVRFEGDTVIIGGVRVPVNRGGRE